ALIVEFPDCDMDFVLPGLPPKHIAIRPARTDFKFGGRAHIRLQFPLQPGKIVTAHCMQGKTLPDGVAYYPPDPQEAKHAHGYVAMSRATSLDKLYLLTPVTLEQLNRKPSVDLLQFDRKCEFLALKTAEVFLQKNPLFAETYDKSWMNLDSNPLFHLPSWATEPASQAKSRSTRARSRAPRKGNSASSSQPNTRSSTLRASAGKSHHACGKCAKQPCVCKLRDAASKTASSSSSAQSASSSSSSASSLSASFAMLALQPITYSKAVSAPAEIDLSNPKAVAMDMSE